ncbi:uncharacterized protein [Rutidosis leptorrhynchoides]|uniref:uncharacterized protein isoform X2 n=1 Tax=Rutidosis leptorrhynchoides TaxID=125765 RepID=UPI003A99DFCC
MTDSGETPLLTASNNIIMNTKSNYWIIDTLESTGLSWIFLDQSSIWKAGLSWSIFFLLTLCVPILSHLAFHCSTCDHQHQRPFDLIVQSSLSVFSTISFLNLLSFSRKYGLRRFLFLDKLSHVSDEVRYGYSDQLNIFRLEDFAKVFEKQGDVGLILMEHLTIRRTLRIISHRFRGFVLSTLVLVTASQFASLLVTTRTGSLVNISTAGELALCSTTLVSGLFICLRNAAKITHKAQSVTSLAAKWHTCATIDSFDDMGPTDETSSANNTSKTVNYHFDPVMYSDNEEGDDDDDVLDNTKLVPIYRHTITYQKRQALVTYMENNRAGITVFGFMLDRTYLHTIFALQMSLTLWILNKTIGLS